jgi:hypothetical protein
MDILADKLREWHGLGRGAVRDVDRLVRLHGV